MDHIVIVYERQAHECVIQLRQVEIALASVALLVALMADLFIIRPGVQADALAPRR